MTPCCIDPLKSEGTATGNSTLIRVSGYKPHQLKIRSPQQTSEAQTADTFVIWEWWEMDQAKGQTPVKCICVERLRLRRDVSSLWKIVSCLT